MNSLTEGFRFHLLWVQDPKRYQIIIDSLRAEKMMQVLDFDKSNRYSTNFQNRRIRALQGLETLERREIAKQQLAHALKLPSQQSKSKDLVVTEVLEGDSVVNAPATNKADERK